MISDELDRLTGHTSGAGTAPYRRDEITKSLAQDRAAAVAVMSPVEILFQFTGDRAQGQQITVRLDADDSAASEIRSFLPQIGRCTSRRIGSCLFVSHRSVESSEIENYYSP